MLCETAMSWKTGSSGSVLVMSFLIKLVISMSVLFASASSFPERMVGASTSFSISWFDKAVRVTKAPSGSRPFYMSFSIPKYFCWRAWKRLRPY